MTDDKEHFSMVLAATVHDIKNALSIISQQLSEMVLENQNSPKVALLQHEVNRMNGMLIQLLTMYKHDKGQLPVQMGFVNVNDFIDEQLYAFEIPLNHAGISIQVDVDEELEWYFDESLLGVLISNIIGNTIRYAESEIRISIQESQNQLVIDIQDDGKGFPEQMLEEQNQVILGVSSSHSRTGLGLYFAKLITSLHGHDDKIGTIQLHNNEIGGNFSIVLP